MAELRFNPMTKNCVMIALNGQNKSQTVQSGVTFTAGAKQST